MAENADQVYKTRDEIIAEVLSAWQARIPDMNLGPDSIARIWTEVFGTSVEGLYLMAQLLHDDMFIQTQNALALMRSGEQFGRPQKAGTLAVGAVRFSGAGGTEIPLGATVGAPRPALEDDLVFSTTAIGMIPNPGIPDAPTAVDGGVGVLAAGTYEWVVSFVTDGGETMIGLQSDPLILAATKQADITAIAIGGPGTTARKLYRRVDGGDWKLVPTGATLTDNVTTALTDNTATDDLGAVPLTESTAERVSVAAESEDIGTEYNVMVGTITELLSVEPGLSDVVNLAAFTGGSDQEDFETFRVELLKRVRSAQSGSVPDLEGWATEIDSVEAATAFPNVDLAGAPAPGTVVVRISGPNGAVPDGAKVTEVQDYLDSKDLANITIEVGTFTPVLVDVTVNVDLDSDYTLTDVTPQVEIAITDYINSVPVDGTVYLSGIVASVFGLAGILNLTVSLPATDQNMAATEKAVADTITVT